MSNKITKKSLILTTASILSVSISTALYAAQPLSMQNADNVLSEVTSSPLPKRFIIKYKQAANNQAASNQTTSFIGSQSAFVRLAGVKEKLKKLRVKVKAEFPDVNMISAELSTSQAMNLAMDDNVEYVEEDLPRRFMAQTVPYGIGMVQADQVDDMIASANAGGKKICIIDSGLDLPHEDMGAQGGTITGTNNSGTGNWYNQGGPHGTHVAGTIAALNNGIGVRGVIGTDPNLHIIKVFNAAGWGYSSTLVNAINDCVSNGADVINMSLGGSGSSTSEQNGIQAAYDAGVLLIAAAGNDGVASATTDLESFPASYDAVMSVAAVDSDKALADFSQKNSQVEISGPGVDVYSIYPEGTGSVVEVSVANMGYTANAMENQGQATGSLYDFAMGETIDTGAAGNVCLIQRGNISFYDKVKACQDSGGVGAILYNNAPGSFGGTLGDANATSIPSVTVSDTDGAAMKNNIGLSASINIGAGNYGKMSGTSMASPHVAGVAALVWSHHPSCTNVEIRNVLNSSAQDLGAAGRDVKFGYGLAQTKDAIDYITANGCDGSGGDTGGGGGTTPDTVLENGQVKTELTAATGNDLVFTMEVPAGATDINFAMTGGNGDADLYVKFGAEPTDSVYDCRPYKSGNVESCASTQAGGTYYVRLKAYSDFTGVSLTGSYTEPTTGGGNTINPIDTTINNVTVARRTWKRYTLDLADGYADLTVTLSGGSGDADLYVTQGKQSTTSVYDCRPYKNGNNEACNFTDPAKGVWYVDVYGYSAASGMTLNLQATPK
ncbi:MULTISPECIES: S8 family serine peptidase [unclassified Colwellia]|uniref:S8 family serine peptidase n=1 Tax=unclassified Colwellia TaxID=196834 RepID=UPI0015F732DD|nr:MULTISPECIES: S8 family serine peptidase [unclassified Colwellia]MBA6234089.1 S8 family serine peptidase [Colwellia sp. MB02u-7]MBA6237989.1 S8 family serine peptidase [Colwellia sp. MB02u-11]MBA6257698.1 S8 family serine peptidase [Colwellia sp. MB3u-28]MBA6259455.1 S8 family serine peptidase [Colwellia sp. MB3u-41]MBA6300763.1 S8 family serine peptidase [Colwellia sp. MB3u-22]